MKTNDKLKNNLDQKMINKKFKKIKSTIKDAKATKKDVSRFEKRIRRRSKKYKTYNKFSILRKGVTNNYDQSYDILMNSRKELKNLKKLEKKELKKQKEILKNKIKKHKKELKKLIKNTKLEKKQKEILKNKIKKHKKELKKQKEIFKNKIKKHKKELKKLIKNTKLEKKQLRSEIQQINILNGKPKGPKLIENNEGHTIEVKNVSKIYTTQSVIFHALKNINLSIKKGTFNVILGPSGSGKTTLLNVISGLDRVTMGSVSVNGYNIQGLSTSQMTLFRKEKLGFVFQSYNLLSSLNVRDNIDVGRSLQKNRNKRMNIKNLLVNMSMENNRKKMTYELSGGQQQRVSIGRALSKTPDILIGDEPTGALDQDTSIKIFELFQEINKKNQTTVIIVTHNHNFAKLADLIIKIKDGKIEKLINNEKPIKAIKLKEI